MAWTSSLSAAEIPNTPLGPYVLEKAAALGEQPALIDGASDRTISYGQLVEGVRRVGRGLADRGLGKGEVVGIFSPNLPEYALAFYGIAGIGGVTTTVNPLYTTDELAKQLEDCKARFLITVPPFLDKAREAAQRAGVREVFVIGEAPGATPFAELLRSQGAPPEVAIDPAEDLVALPYSSGTTGLSKGVMLTHRNLVANIAQCHGIESFEPGDTTIAVLPFFHIYGMAVLLNMVLRQGATAVTMPRFELEAYLALMQKHRCKRTYLVPPVILALAKHPLVEQYDLSSLRVIMSGAAPLGADLAQAAAARLGCVVKQGYGLTETSPVTHVNPDDAPRPGSAGKLVRSTECRIVDPVMLTDLGAGERGEVWLRGPQVMKGYLGKSEATQGCMTPDGWFRSGDIGYVDADGYLFIVDRLKELIKYKGMQVPPAELEALLITHPAVADVAVIGSPDDEAGEVPKAFVVLKAEVTPEALMEWVGERVAPHKRIRRLEVVKEIPKSLSGKILRRVLVERERAARASGLSET